MGLRVDLPFRATSSRQDASSCRVTPRQWTTTRLPIATTQGLFDMDEPASSAIPPAAPPPTQVGEVIAADVLSSPASPSTQFTPSDFIFSLPVLNYRKRKAVRPCDQCHRTKWQGNCTGFLPCYHCGSPSNPPLPLAPTRKLTPYAPPLKATPFRDHAPTIDPTGGVK